MKLSDADEATECGFNMTDSAYGLLREAERLLKQAATQSPTCQVAVGMLWHQASQLADKVGAAVDTIADSV